MPSAVRSAIRLIQPELPLEIDSGRGQVRCAARQDIVSRIESFNQFGTISRKLTTVIQPPAGPAFTVPVLVNEFWTARQRAAHSLHEISYRACFKPQLPRFFIERLTKPGERVYDPFMGRGTTLLEAALHGRVATGCDLNPLSIYLIRPRFRPPPLPDIAARLEEIPWHKAEECPEDLLVFYHPETLSHISALKAYLARRERAKLIDPVDDWIRLVALNRLTGHSPGFFSVYTMPPNQAVSIKSQRKINARRNQIPPRRDVAQIILKKSRSLLADCNDNLRRHLDRLVSKMKLVTARADKTPSIRSDTVDLVVTSPPFLNVVSYATDNWLRSWFVGIDPARIGLTVPSKVDEWRTAMTAVFQELFRVVRPGGHVAFEVGEVSGGKLKLEEVVIPCGMSTGFRLLCVMINDQKFTKTANCWGVDNNLRGTNTNRLVLFKKD